MDKIIDLIINELDGRKGLDITGTMDDDIIEDIKESLASIIEDNLSIADLMRPVSDKRPEDLEDCLILTKEGYFMATYCREDDVYCEETEFPHKAASVLSWLSLEDK